MLSILSIDSDSMIRNRKRLVDLRILAEQLDTRISAIQEGLAFALGTESTGPKWKVGQTDPEHSPEFEPDADREPVNVPVITLNDERPNLTIETDLNNLELGRQPRLPLPKRRIAELLTEVSDRVAGNNTATPVVEQNSQNEFLDYSPDLSPLSRRGSNVNASVESVDILPGLENYQSRKLNRLCSLDVPLTHTYSPFKEEERLYGKTLHIFSPSSKLRLWCHRLIQHRLTNSCVLALIVLQTALLAYRQWNPMARGGYYYKGYNWADYVLIAIQTLYTLEAAVKIILYGFIDDSAMFASLGLYVPTNGLSITVEQLLGNHWPWLATKFQKKKYDQYVELDTFSASEDPITPRLSRAELQREVDKLKLHRAFLRDSWQRIDMVAIVMFWISLILSKDRYDVKHHVFLFRALSCLRILRLCNLTAGTNVILRACKTALPELVDITFCIGFFWIIFGMIGVQSFKSSLSRHCVWQNPQDSNDTWVNSKLFCGSYLSPSGKKMPYLDRNDVEQGNKGFTCPPNSKCISGANPYGGTVNFDNIFQSMEMVFVTMSANTFTDIMYNTMNTDSLASSLFFIFTIFAMTTWLLNIFIATVVRCFDVAQTEEKKSMPVKKSPKNLFGVFAFNDDLHGQKVAALANRKPLLKMYYRFEVFFVLVIAADLIVQCWRHHGMSDLMRHTLYRCEAAFTTVLFVEIILRFALYLPDWRTFFLSRRNCFDLFLAIVTGVIIIGPVKNSLRHAYYWLTVFQVARLYRVVLAVSVTRDLWRKITKNIGLIFDLVLFYFILLFLCSIIVARYFEGTVPAEDVSDVQFAVHTLPNAFITLYLITSTENWTEPMYALQQRAKNTLLRVFGSMLLIGWFIISNWTLLNLFIAVTSKALEESDEGKRRHQLRQFITEIINRLQLVEAQGGIFDKWKKKIFKGPNDNIEKAVVNLLLSGTAVNDFLDKEGDFAEDAEDVQNLPLNAILRFFQVNYARLKAVFANPFYDEGRKAGMLSTFDPAQFAKTIISERNMVITSQNKYLRENPMFNTVFYMLGPQHKLRRFCQRIVKSSFGERINGVEPHRTIKEAFTFIMFLFTVGIVVTACYLTPLYRKDLVEDLGVWNWGLYLDIVFIVVFTGEFLIKITADGIVFTPNAYMRSSWNWIDFVALLSIWIEFIAYIKNDGNLSRVVRGLKALRALRILTISETAKNNFHYTMISGFGKILSAALISVSLIFPFSVWGLNVFNGRLGYCVDQSSPHSTCFNEYENTVFNWQVYSPNTWTEPILQLNRFSSAFSSLYQIVSLEGWADLLINVMQSTGQGSPQKMFASPFNGVFVVLFNFVSIVFILTLFVSVVISNYSRVTGRAYLIDAQIQWYHVKKYLMQVRPSKRQDVGALKGLRRFCYKMTVEKNKWWNLWFNFMLLSHVILILMETYPTWFNVQYGRYIVFCCTTLTFLINVYMLGYAQGLRTYFLNKWNAFILTLTHGALITTILTFVIDSGSVFNNFNKLFLVGMLIFVFPRIDRLSRLLRFGVSAFPLLISLMFTWFVVFMVYAIAMNQVFGMTKIGPNTTNNINLRSVPKALILLFRCSFGEGWNYIMEDFTLETPLCTANVTIDDSDCGSKGWSYVFFMLWNIILMYIFMNLFVSLILDSFSFVGGGSKYEKLISRGEIRKFKALWQRFDPSGTGFIAPSELPKFLHSLDGALSFHFYTGSLSIPELCCQWVHRNNPHDPYDISLNYEKIDEITAAMDVEKIRERRRNYELFLEEALMMMELNDEPGISFQRIILQIPLYSAFDPGECLNLLDFLDRRLHVQRLERRIKIKRCYETIAAYSCRWKYVHNKKHGVSKHVSDPDVKESKNEVTEELSSSESDGDAGEYVPCTPVQIQRSEFEQYPYVPERPRSATVPVMELSVAMQLSGIGETLENSSWGPAFREVTSQRRSPKQESPRRPPSLFSELNPFRDSDTRKRPKPDDDPFRDQ